MRAIAIGLIAVATLAAAAIRPGFEMGPFGAKPVDIPCVHWEPLTSGQNTDPTDLFVAAYTYVYGGFDQCQVLGDIFPCFATNTSTWGHHDYQSFYIPSDYCRTWVDDTLYEANNFYVPKKGPKWHTWKWQLVQTGGQVPDNAIRYGQSVMARSAVNPPGLCMGKGFTGWAVGQENGTFGQVHFTIQQQAFTTASFEVAICKAYIPTPAPGTPGPTVPPPTPPPFTKPYIRFGNAIPDAHNVLVTITQGNISYTWTNYAFSQFSGWVELFENGVGEISVYSYAGGQQGPLQMKRQIPLTPGPLVVVTRGMWPPTSHHSVETIAASYVQPVVGSGVRLFNLSPGSHPVNLVDQTTGATLAQQVPYSIGSGWAPVDVEQATFVVTSSAGKALASHTTTPPQSPFVFTIFFLGLENATAGSVFAPQALPLIDAPEL